MRTQKCNSCGAILDISHLEKGAKFSCSSCGTVLVVGHNVAAKKSLRDSGPVFKRRSKGDEVKVASTRRRTAAAGRSRGAPARERRPAKSGPPVPLIAGGAIVVVGIIVAVVASGGGDSASPTGTTGGAAAAASKVPDAQDWWTQATRNSDMSARKLNKATIARLLKEGEDYGFAGKAGFGWEAKKKELYAQLLKEAPKNREANRAAGNKSIRDYPDFEGVWQHMSAAPWLPEKYYKFLDQLAERNFNGKGHLWLKPEEFERFSRTFDDYVEFRKRVEANPTELAIEQAVERTRSHPILGNYGAVAMKIPPFVIFFGSRELKALDDSPEERERVQAKEKEILERANKTRRPVYEAFLEAFEERYRKPLNLPPFKPTDILYQWIFEDRDGFNRYQVAAVGNPLHPGVLAYFSPQNRWVFSPERESAEAGGISNENVVAHETTHQIHFHFSKHPTRKGVNFFNQAPAVWFQEGWAEYFGGSCHKTDSGQWKFFWYELGRVEALRRMKKRGLPLIPLRFLVERASYNEFNKWFANYWLEEARRIVSDEGNDEAERFISQPTYFGALYAQSWLFVYFLNEYKESGKLKYRDGFQDFLWMTLRGRQKPAKYVKNAGTVEKWPAIYDAFSDIFGIKTEADWARLQREHDKLLEQVLKDAPKLPKREESGGEGEDEKDGESEME